MNNSSIHGARAEHDVHVPASMIRERPAPVTGPLGSVSSAKLIDGEPTGFELEEKELPFTD